MKTLFISDLHLHPNEQQLNALFLAFLENNRKDVDALYIIGDLFEAWVGDDLQTEFTRTMAAAMKRYSEQCAPIYFIHGNRDFLIGKRFAKQAGCTILPEPSVITLYGENAVLLHGDGLCLNDKRHQQFRALTQRTLLKKAFLWLPLKTRLKIAEKIRTQSYQRGSQLTDEVMDTVNAAVLSTFTQSNTHLMIHGHTHRPSIEFFNHNSQFLTRIVLSDWGKFGNALVCYDTGEKRLVYF